MRDLDAPRIPIAEHPDVKRMLLWCKAHVEGGRALMREMMERSQRRTVPQIFIGDFHVGGYDDLAELDAFGKLDPLLGREAGPDTTQHDSADVSDDSPT